MDRIDSIVKKISENFNNDDLEEIILKLITAKNNSSKILEKYIEYLSESISFFLLITDDQKKDIIRISKSILVKYEKEILENYTQTRKK